MTDIYVETCTIHDDIHLTHHDIHISGSDSSSSSSLSSLGGAGESGLLGRSHQRAGGFPLSIKNDNRFIIWRIIGNKLELIEQSLAHKLNGNFKRISFKDATILPRVHLHKSHEIGMSFSVTILFATTSRLYRIVLPFNKNEHSNTSILSNLCSSDFTNVDASNTFALNLSHVEQPADILVSSRGDALFAFVMPNSAVCCVQMPPSTTQVSSSGRPLMSTQNSGPTLPVKFEINQPTLVKRLWSGLKRGSTAGSLGSSGGLAGSGLNGNENQFASFRLFQLEQSLYLISLCKDFKLKIWCIKSNQCVHTEDMIKYIQFDGDIIWDECQVELLSLPDNCKTSIIISTSDRVKICNLNIELNENIFTINEISRREVIKSGELINVQTTRFNAWLTFKTENESTQVKAVPIGSDDDRNRPNDIIVVDGSQRLANKANQRAKKTRSRRNIANDDSEENIEDDDDEAENDDDEDEDEIDDEERIFIDPGFSDLDVKELYLKLIFEPYRFSKSNMIKSLGILGQNVSANENSSRLISASKSVDEIKELVVRSIEQAVQTHPSYANCGEEEFLSLNVKYWSKYYTMLKQYDYDSRLALGFFADPHNESVVIMIRKNALSFYGKADLSQYYHIVPIEYVQTTFADYFTTDEDTSESESNTTDLFLVFKLLKTINDHVLNSSVAASSDSSRTGKLQYISSLAHELIISNASFLSEFSKYFAEINNTDELTSKLTVLLELFDVEKTRKRLDYLNRTLDSDGDEDDQDNMETDSSIRLSITSDITIDSVLASLKELISKRCEFFRNICVLLTIISSYYETLNISSQVANDLFQKHFESCLNYSNSFEYLKWLCEIYPTSIDKNNLKNSIKRTFDLLDNFQCEQLKSSKDFNQLLLKTFLQSFARFSIPSDSNYQLSLKNYSQLSIYLLANILHAIWPMNLEESFSLIRFFIQNIQYIHLNNYCMQTKWWPTGKNLRLFLLGNCCLFFNNIDQSITYFLRASFNLDKDRCLTKFMGIESASSSHARQSIAANNRRSILINKRTAEKFSQMKRESIFFSSSSHHGDALFSIDSENQLLLDYYTRCIHYYDLNGNVEAAIELIQTALDQSQFDARCKSKLYGVLFKSYMDLEDYERAHTALMSNTDREWKKHSLKHFCTELCKQRRSDLLVGLDYGDMLVELLAFLYKRAQNTDLKTEHGDYYYRVLYAIYVKSKDYRRAAFCMYECSQRLRREINGIESLKRQEKCLLACLNLLKSVDKKLSWLAVLSPDPSTLSASSSSADIAALETRLRLLNNLMSTDTTAEQQAFNDQLVDSNLNVEIVDFDEINRNYMLVHYMIKLSSIMSNQSSIASFYSADEIIGLLVKYSLFDDAIALCLAFKPLESSPLVNIITGLVDRCCDLNSANALKALSSNDANNGAIGELTIEYDILKYNESLPAPISPYENPCSFKWKLLHSYLEKFKNVVYYKATCKRLLTLNYEIPSNIIASFKRLNSNALLQIYVNYGLWSEAAELISEYINAILVDEAATKFGTKDSLTPSQLSSQVLLPYAVIDSLLKYLSTGGDDIKEVDLELKKKINEYLYQVKSASESKIKLIGTSRH